VRASLGVDRLAMIDLVLIDFGLIDVGGLLRVCTLRRDLCDDRNDDGGETRRRPTETSFNHAQTAYRGLTANTQSDPPAGTLASRSSPENIE
jgi:hypothetical protein